MLKSFPSAENTREENPTDWRQRTESYFYSTIGKFYVADSTSLRPLECFTKKKVHRRKNRRPGTSGWGPQKMLQQKKIATLLVKKTHLITSSDSKLESHFSLENSYAQVLRSQIGGFYTKKSVILSAFQRCQ